MMPINPIQKRIILPVFAVILLLVSFVPPSQTIPYGEPEFYGNPEEVMALLAKAFSDSEISFLDEVASDQFCNSAEYAFLKDRLGTNYLNLNHRAETIEKEFLIKNQSKKLIVVFERNKSDRTWSVADVFYRKNGQDQPFKTASFSPLSYATYFNDFLIAIKKKDPAFFGLAPHGKLNINEIKDMELGLTNNTTITYKNIILHDGDKPTSFIYITLKDYPCNNQENKCGWLVEEAGTMGKFYPDDVFVQYLIDNSNYPDLKAPNDINRSLDISPFQQSGIFEAPEANLNALVFKTNFEESTIFKKYIVQSGDNLSSIAARHGIRLKHLKALNSLEDDAIYVGQSLVVPRD